MSCIFHNDSRPYDRKWLVFHNILGANGDNIQWFASYKVCTKACLELGNEMGCCET